MEKGSESVIIVDGEAPESSSDEEIESFDIPIGTAREVCESAGSSISTMQSLGNEFPSAYHKKLYQKNEDLWNHLSGLLSRTIETSSKNLIATDQLLLKCQVSKYSSSSSAEKEDDEAIVNKLRSVITDQLSNASNVIISPLALVFAPSFPGNQQLTLQSVSKSTKKVNSDLDKVTAKLRDLLSANFLPQINSV